MTKEEEVIEYFKFHRKIFCEDHLKICPKDSIAYQATLKEKEFYDMAIKALEQMPSDDEVTITMKRGTLKCSNQVYIVYNKDWFRKHFATEIEIITGYDGYSKQPNEDCVSRQAVLEEIPVLWNGKGDKDYCMETLRDFVTELPSVTPTRKKGKWIFTKTIFDKYGCTVECPSCHKKWKTYDEIRWEKENKYCPNCGAEMESEE